MFGFSLLQDSARSSSGGLYASAVTHFQSPTNQNSTIAFAQNVSDLSRAPGYPVTMQVNLANVFPINGFRTIFTYDTDALKGTSLDYANSIFATDRSVKADCIDGRSVSDPNGACPPGDSQRMVDVFMFTQSGNLLTQTSGPLFTISFNVLSRGLSPFHFTFVALFNGSFTNPLVQSFDGFFSNKQCGTLSGNPFVCQPAIADFTVSPPAPRVATLALFNATTSKSPNPGASISTYTWDWDEGGFSGAGQTVTQPTLNHAFVGAFVHSVTLTVTDSYGITGVKTVRVRVIEIIIDLAVGDLRADRTQGILPGQPLTIVASVQNLGTRPQNATLTLCLEAVLPAGLSNRIFPPCAALRFFSPMPAVQLKNANATYTNLDKGASSPPLQITWDTTPYSPRVYRIDAIVDPARAPNGTIIEPVSNLSNNFLFMYVQIIYPRPLIFFGLSLLQTAGIGVLLLAGLATARVVIKRKPEVNVGPAVG